MILGNRDIFFSLILIMVMMEGCYCGGNNNKVDSGLGGEDVRGHCGAGYYPAWDNECAGVEGCREIEINKCGCHCKRCYFDKCVEVGCREPCEVGYNDIEEIADSEKRDVVNDIFEEEIIDGGIGDVSDIEDIYNPYGPHFKLLAKRAGLHTMIRGDYILYTTRGKYVFEPPYGVLGSDLCVYKISTEDNICLGENIDSEYTGIYSGNIFNGVICWTNFSTVGNGQVRYTILGSREKKTIYEDPDADNFAINSKYIFFSGRDSIYKFEIATGKSYKLKTPEGDHYSNATQTTLTNESVLIYETFDGRVILYDLNTDTYERLDKYL